MMPDGMRTDPEQGRDFRVVFAVAHPVEDFLLAPAEATGRRRRSMVLLRQACGGSKNPLAWWGWVGRLVANPVPWV
jgi:hypothetical protein